ncbi:MAG TPA: lipocalin family protein [Mucilaginibacter sp.]|jgi:hypothetical protein|nr:lipocalin family protein [Mucilaginibacter sp.]
MIRKITLIFIVAFSVFGALILTGCTKQALQQPTSQQLVGKWIMKTAIGNYTVQGTNRKDTTSFTSSDYFNFKADGTLAIMESQQPHNGNWQVVNNKLYISNTDYIDYPQGFDLTTLTPTSLQLHYVESDALSSLEQTLNLSK